MAWIEMISARAARGKLKELYEKLFEPWGGVDNIMRIHSLNPRSMLDHHELYITLMRCRSELSKAQREMIAVAVSSANHCHY